MRAQWLWSGDHASKYRGVLIEDLALQYRPWCEHVEIGDSRLRAAANELFRRHKPTFESHLAALICGKERMIRQLEERRRQADEHRMELLRGLELLKLKKDPRERPLR